MRGETWIRRELERNLDLNDDEVSYIIETFRGEIENDIIAGLRRAAMADPAPRVRNLENYRRHNSGIKTAAALIERKQDERRGKLTRR